MKVRWCPLNLPLARPFAISRSTIEVRHNVLVEIEADDGLIGRGEAEPTPYYNETAETALAALEAFDQAPLADIQRGDSDVDRIVTRCREQLGHGNMSVVAALDAALWDLRGRQLGCPVWELLNAPSRCWVPTSYTIGMADPDTMACEAERVRDIYGVLKIKVGGDQDLECLKAIRRVTDLPIRVDANAAWSGAEAVERIAELMPFDIELIEQPCARDDLDGLRRARDASPVPIIADESCHTADDVDRLVDVVDGVNIKLTKSGGLGEGKRIIERARQHDMLLMIGCMTSSSLAITTGSHLCGWMDFVDLDGNLLLARDPFSGAVVEEGVLQIPEGPGLGVEPRSDELSGGENLVEPER